MTTSTSTSTTVCASSSVIVKGGNRLSPAAHLLHPRGRQAFAQLLPDARAQRFGAGAEPAAFQFVERGQRGHAADRVAVLRAAELQGHVFGGDGRHHFACEHRGAAAAHASGRFIGESDETNARRVVVIGEKLIETLRLPDDPVGRYIQFSDEWFRVIGVMEKRGEIFGISQDEFVIVPSKTGRSLIGNQRQLDIVIGIMHMMLVSVTERTREIGILKALGARRRDIVTQFVTEATLLSAGGGVLGIAIAYLLLGATAWLVPSFPASFIPWWMALLALPFATGVGVVFGVVPASRAADLDPIESLRFE